ncbi:MAG: YceD family protein [Ornithinimicrobium sp.]
MAQRDDDGIWVFDTRELVRSPGAMRTVNRTVHTPSMIGTEVIAIPEQAPVVIEMRMESVVEGVLATADVRADARGQCVRCLDDLGLAVIVTVQELFAYPNRADHRVAVGDREQDEDGYRLTNDLMDIEPMVRDAVVTSLPFQPVCRIDCPGLCAQCGARLEDDPKHAHENIDPRWSALTQLSQSNPDKQADVAEQQIMNTPNEIRT